MPHATEVFHDAPDDDVVRIVEAHARSLYKVPRG